MTNHSQHPLRRSEASAYMFERYGIRRSPDTLAKLAVIGGGPLFFRVGRYPFYSPADLDAWVASFTSEKVHTTKELRMPPTGPGHQAKPAGHG